MFTVSVYITALALLFDKRFYDKHLRRSSRSIFILACAYVSVYNMKDYLAVVDLPFFYSKLANAYIAIVCITYLASFQVYYFTASLSAESSIVLLHYASAAVWVYSLAWCIKTVGWNFMSTTWNELFLLYLVSFLYTFKEVYPVCTLCLLMGALRSLCRYLGLL